MNCDFHFAKTPEIYFGAGKLALIGKLCKKYGRNALLITGKESLNNSGNLDKLIQSLKTQSIKYSHIFLGGEPSPSFIDSIVDEYKSEGTDVIIAAGGGSVVDAGKAISAMMLLNDSVIHYLEGVGNKVHPGKKIPFIAIPTTSGTGSETTKNAVLSDVGENGFKKSLRHNNFVPDITIVDPELTLSLPVHVTAACGMDAFTQLLESYVSTNASIMTDSLSFEGLRNIRDSLIKVCSTHQSDINIRSSMAYASMVSGITLANAGLGTVHGFASAIGGFFNIPHGVVCGTLMGPVTRKTIEVLTSNKKSVAFKKFARIGKRMIHGCDKDDAYYALKLADLIDEWTEKLNIPRLSQYGIKESDFDKIIASTGNKNNPVKLKHNDLTEILIQRL